MADRQIPERPRQRAHQKKASNPDIAPSTFEEGDNVWYKTPQSERIAMIVVELECDPVGSYSYRIKDEDGEMYENGRWIKESSLSPGSKYTKGQFVWYKSSEGQRLNMTVAAKKLESKNRVLYQIKDGEGKLYGDGEWVGEESLKPNPH